jgi:hypothetical protein
VPTLVWLCQAPHCSPHPAQNAKFEVHSTARKVYLEEKFRVQQQLEGHGNHLSQPRQHAEAGTYTNYLGGSATFKNARLGTKSARGSMLQELPRQRQYLDWTRAPGYIQAESGIRQSRQLVEAVVCWRQCELRWTRVHDSRQVSENDDYNRQRGRHNDKVRPQDGSSKFFQDSL